MPHPLWLYSTNKQTSCVERVQLLWLYSTNNCGFTQLTTCGFTQLTNRLVVQRESSCQLSNYAQLRLHKMPHPLWLYSTNKQTRMVETPLCESLIQVGNRFYTREQTLYQGTDFIQRLHYASLSFKWGTDFILGNRLYTREQTLYRDSTKRVSFKWFVALLDGARQVCVLTTFVFTSRSLLILVGLF